MIRVSNLQLRFGSRTLFKDVNLNFTPGNCYGIIGANGAGKSTFLKILSGELEPTQGDFSIGKGQRISNLQQDQNAFDDQAVMETVIWGHKRLYDVLKERDILYAKEDFSEADGNRAAELEEALGELDGYEAEANAAVLLKGLGISEDFHPKMMGELPSKDKVRVLLAQALFDSPDILLLDEPTNNLDLESIGWLEEFLINFPNTVVVVSHDRHFLNQVCTHIADIDFGKIRTFIGNYDFWFQASQLTMRQRRDENKKKGDKAEELKEFIRRFSSNASKARQATSRKKLLEKITLEDLPVSTRKFPFIEFKPERECGKAILDIENLCHQIPDALDIQDFNLSLDREDKIVLVGANDLVKTTLFQILMDELQPDSGKVRMGTTITPAYFPKDNSSYFETDLNLIDWLRQFSEDKKENTIRSFLGRMLFSSDEPLKPIHVLSGGEKVRCILSKMMLANANLLILDEPTNHLDLESIQALNNALIKFPEPILFTSHDHQFIDTIANRIIEFTPGGIIDKSMSFDDYLKDPAVKELRDQLYHEHVSL